MIFDIQWDVFMTRVQKEGVSYMCVGFIVFLEVRDLYISNQNKKTKMVRVYTERICKSHLECVRRP